MGMDFNHEASVISKPAFTAVGLKWEGTFAEAGSGSIRAVHEKLIRLLPDIPGQTAPGLFYGLSYHAHPGAPGFIHYAVVEVEGSRLSESIPNELLCLEVPGMTYAKCEHRKGQSIDKSYQNIYLWIESQGFQLADAELTHFEIYRADHDPYGTDPEFAILIPIAK
jgi:predicted transcriptional regulator YdeE